MIWPHFGKKKERATKYIKGEEIEKFDLDHPIPFLSLTKPGDILSSFLCLLQLSRLTLNYLDTSLLQTMDK